jgi:hypothetical protein
LLGSRTSLPAGSCLSCGGFCGRSLPFRNTQASEPELIPTWVRSPVTSAVEATVRCLHRLPKPNRTPNSDLWLSSSQVTTSRGRHRASTGHETTDTFTLVICGQRPSKFSELAVDRRGLTGRGLSVGRSCWQS